MHVSRDGRWLVVTGNIGTARRDSVWIADLHGGTRRCTRCSPRPTTCSATRGSTATACSTCTPPTARRAGGSPSPTRAPRGASTGASWSPRTRTRCCDGVRRLERPDGPPLLVLARSPARGRRAGPARRRRRHPARHRAAARHRVAHRPLGGRPRHPGRGRAGCGWAGPTSSPRRQVHRFDSQPARRCWRRRRRARSRCPPSASAQRTFTSADGTTVRMFVLARRDATRPAAHARHRLRRLRHQPASPPTARPRWPGSRPAACYAVVSLRGGGEEGEDWHLAGNRAQQAERVRRLPRRRATRWSTRATPPPDQLAIMGGSNGGLLVGAALTQRPDRATGPWSARRRCWTWCATRSSRSAAPGTTSTAPPPTRRSSAGCCPTRPTTTCEPGTAYPAVLFTVFESDTRVDPLHARKMCAALQHATTGDPARARS